ncbi:TonB family protein [Caulobacter sp. 602-2]|uniref:TonB family protein n=1 Tax=Caulobacter sp. 602-2 TaxID=2710887 RepID=A0A6G4QZE7_9CAUL|nr:energy transducer TonB [Caulobacter sp. 602-2]NGM50911.1 TonB family protein [Caulobacter sp. 602-2]
MALSVGLHAALAGAILFGGFAPAFVAPPPAAPMIVELETTSPPVPQLEVPPGPQQQERQAARPTPPKPPPVKTAPAAPEPVFFTPPRPASPVDPGPAAPQTTAPPTQPAPVAQRAASNAVATWEGQVLAALEKKRRYPPAAQARRQQGVAHVRFRMSRDGKVLWSRLERSSGFGELDRAAVNTPKRAQPLPPVPADRPDEVELVVPVEFFIARP